MLHAPGAIAHPASFNRYAIALAVLSAAVVGALLLAGLATWFLWPPSGLAEPSTHIYLGSYEKYPIGEPVFFAQDGAKFWLVRPDEKTVLALYATDTVSGCTLPWRPKYAFKDPRTGDTTEGWFRDVCHGDAIYDITGQRVSGLATRNMDYYPTKLKGDKVVVTTRLMRGAAAR